MKLTVIVGGACLLALLLPLRAQAQAISLSHGGPIAITAQDGIEWRQTAHEVIARGDAKAVRGDTTVAADRLTAWYRKKDDATGKAAHPAQPGVTAADMDTGGNEIYRVQADGSVHIYTPTDQAWGDRATYDLDQAVMVMTGRHLKLTTPNEVLTARDDVEYWTLKHMAVARGDAVVVTKDGRRLAADTLVAYTAPSSPAAQPAPAAQHPGGGDVLGSSGKLTKVEAYGHVSVRTAQDTVTGDRGVYVPDSGIAVLEGKVQITRGQNQLNGAMAEVNLKTGVARLISAPRRRVQGLVVPNDSTNKGLTEPGQSTPTQGASR